MKFISMLLLIFAGAAFAQPPGEWVNGNDSRVPDWTVLEMVLHAAVKADDTYYEGGEQYLKSSAGVSKNAARALLAYTRATTAAAAESGPSLKDELCPRREKLVAGDALARAVDARMTAKAERRRQRVEGAYALLGTDDAEKLRQYVTTSRDTTRVFQTDVAELAEGIGDPRAFLDRLCGPSGGAK